MRAGETAGRLAQALQRAVFAAAVLPLVMTSLAQAATARVVRLAQGSAASVTVAAGATDTISTSTAFVDLVVGDQDIADVVPLTDRSFYVHGKKLGTTTVSAYDAQRTLVGTIEIEVSYNVGRLRAELRRRLPHSNISVSSVNGRILLSGSAPDAVAMDQAIQLAKQFGPEVINSITLSQSQQVMLEVRFIEVSRDGGKDLGFEWNVQGRSVVAATGGSVSNSTPFGALLGHLLQGGAKVDVLVSAPEKKGVARRLAEPNLIAMSGQTASFLAGGEFPFPVQGDNGRITVEFKKFGVGLTFTPLVLGDGVINLKIEPEVSQIDPTIAVSVGGVTVPSLIVRRASTNVELRDGQSFAIAGLLQTTNTEAAKQLPWIGEVPVIGALFRSASFEKHESDLAIIITPRLVRPTRPNERLRTPMDSTMAANDVDRFIAGRQETSPAQARFGAGLPPRVASGHMLDLR